MLNIDKLIEIFIHVDDFLKENKLDYQSRFLSSRAKLPTRTPTIAESEIITITICYHLSGMKCFKYYYQYIVKTRLKPYFPSAPSYSRFISLQSRILFLIFAFLHLANKAEQTGLYYVDSKKLAVCNNLRISRNKVFKHIAQIGKTTMGWFYGLKLFCIVNQHGEAVKCTLTPANMADNNENLLKRFFKGLKGKIFADRGFISSKVFDHFYAKGLKIVTGIRSNMKNKFMSLQERLLLRKRGMIECVFSILTAICDIEHTRHRSALNAIVNLFAGIAAYSFLDRKPSIFKNSIFLN